MNTSLTILVPPVRGGVLDYANLLSRPLAARIVVATPETPLAAYGEGDLLLHFSGYGYHPRGVPTWLVQRLRQARPQLRSLGVFFHETYATAPPWRSAFWLSPTQRRITMDLAGLADYWLTNNDHAAAQLRPHAGQAPHRVLPVCSNVGEPDPLPTQRQRRIVVFGGPANRSAVYRGLGQSFWHWAQAQGFQVHDIGPPIISEAFSVLREETALRVHGPLPAQEVSRQLREASHGLVHYPARLVAKSGIFAAYCAHGVCPVLQSSTYQAHDGLEAGLHYIPGIACLLRSGTESSAIGHAARHWYRAHHLQTHVDACRTLLQAVHATHTDSPQGCEPLPSLHPLHRSPTC